MPNVPRDLKHRPSAKARRFGQLAAAPPITHANVLAFPDRETTFRADVAQLRNVLADIPGVERTLRESIARLEIALGQNEADGIHLRSDLAAARDALSRVPELRDFSRGLLLKAGQAAPINPSPAGDGC